MKLMFVLLWSFLKMIRINNSGILCTLKKYDIIPDSLARKSRGLAIKFIIHSNRADPELRNDNNF